MKYTIKKKSFLTKKRFLLPITLISMTGQCFAFDYTGDKNVFSSEKYSSIVHSSPYNFINNLPIFDKSFKLKPSKTTWKSERIASLSYMPRVTMMPKPNYLRTKPNLEKKPRAKLSGFFGTKAIAFSPIASKDDWDRVRNTDFSLDGKKCETFGHCSETTARFQQAVENSKDLRFYDKLSLVNNLVNSQITYQEDIVTYKKTDYWASAQETLKRGWGDCEDYVIMKYSMLRKLGVPAKSMSLVVLKDTSRNLYHAVLAVSTSKGNFILDNVRDVVHQDTQIAHYQPLYSFSDNRSWIHGTPVKEKTFSPVNVAHSLEKIAPGKSFGEGDIIFPPSEEVMQNILPQPPKFL